tara:strand:- start:18829 stop:19617 length:789 start_codon:yes stop_codon:yes gene_type:complete
MDKKILLVGDSCDDIYHFGTCSRLSQEAPVPIFQETFQKIKGGMSGNVKNNLESFGLSVKHLTSQARLEKHRLFDVKFNAHVLRYDVGEMEIGGADALYIEQIFTRYDIESLPKEIDALVISDYNKGFLSHSCIKRLCELYKEVPIFADSKKIDVSCFSNCFLKINEQEFQRCQNLSPSTEVIVTLGERGAKYKDDFFSTTAQEVFDVCGAGDVFLAALTYGFLKEGEITKAIELANKAATLSVSKPQTYTLSLKDINDIKK